VDWTWDDLLRAALQLTEREGEQVSRYGFVDVLHYTTPLAMLEHYNVPLWDESVDPPVPLFDSPAVAEVVRYYADLAYVHEVMPVPEWGSNETSTALIEEGRAVMCTDFALFRESYRTTMLRAQGSLGMLPYPRGTSAANPRQIVGFFISADTAHPEAAWRWLSYLSAHYYQPFEMDQMPGRRSVLEQLSWWNALDDETRAAYEYALAHPQTNDTLSNEMPISKAMKAMFEDGASLEEALALAQEWALKLLEND